MGQGHIIPFLALALQIEQTNTNYAIYFVNTPFNLQKLKSSLPPYSSIRFLEIPFSSSAHGLPPASQNADTLPYQILLQGSHSSSHSPLPWPPSPISASASAYIVLCFCFLVKMEGGALRINSNSLSTP